MLITFIHAKFYANAIAIYNASKMNTHEFNEFEAGVHSPFHTPTGSETWDVIQFRARTAILAAESRTQTMLACPINVRSCHPVFLCHILCFILEHTIAWVARKLQHELRMHIPIVVCCAGKVAAPPSVAGLSDCEAALARGFNDKYFADTNYDFIDLYILSQSLQWSVQCHVTWDYVITPL